MNHLCSHQNKVYYQLTSEDKQDILERIEA